MKTGRYRVGTCEFWVLADAIAAMTRSAQARPGTHVVVERWTGSEWREDFGATFHGSSINVLPEFRRFSADRSFFRRKKPARPAQGL